MESGEAGLEDSKDKKNPDDFKHKRIGLNFIEAQDYFFFINN